MSAVPARPDLCVIGGSEAGRAVAMGAVALGSTVVLIDDGDPSGWRNRDATLLLLRAAARAGARDATWAGIDAGLRRAAVERSHARLAAMTVHVIAGTGRFSDPETVTAGGVTLRPRRIVLATGRSRPDDPASLAIDGLGRLPAAPARIVVPDGDRETLSAAQSLARLGSSVAVAGRLALPDVDPELAAPLLARLGREGIAAVGPEASGSGTTILRSEAHQAALDALDLARAGIARDGNGLRLTPALRTTNPRVYAVGCPGGAASTAMGLAQAGVVLRAALLHLPVRFQPDRVPTIVVTDPEVATVGLSEAAAAARGPVAVWRWPLDPGDPAPGHLKVVTDPRGRIRGAGIVGPGAGDLIGVWALALTRGLALRDLADGALPSDAARAVALSAAASRLRRPWVQRTLGLLRRLP